MSIGAAAMVGLLGSVHCAGMCGPIVAGTCGGIGKDKSGGKAKRLMPMLRYTLSRLVAYSFVGAIMGYTGSGLDRAIHAAFGKSALPWIHWSIALLIALPFIYQGVTFLGFKPLGSKTELVQLGTKERNHSGNSFWRQSKAFFTSLLPKTPAGLGAVTAFFPCGLFLPVWAMAAATGSPLSGALVMGVFALSSAPGALLGASLIQFASRLSLPPFVYALSWFALAGWTLSRPLFWATGTSCH